jgi:hypothetical protein
MLVWNGAVHGKFLTRSRERDGTDTQVDSSKNGVGAVLRQDGKPVEFASRALRQSKRNGANRERSTVHVVWTRTF